MSLKNNILSELNNNKDSDISGQHLAKKFGVSRNAVWKAINALKDDGYVIYSGTNKGYRLSDKSDIISKEEIKDNLTCKDLEIFVFDSVDSTNLEAKKMLIENESKDKFLIIANEQTKGRGRLGRDFYSPKNNGIYFSLVLSPHDTFDSVVSITTYSSVCVAKAIRKLTNKDAKIKWVNDIYIDDKKVCGILTEAVSDFETGTVNNIIIGIGINLYPSQLPENICNKAGFVNSENAIKNKLVAHIVNELMKFNENKDSYITEYKELSLVIGKEIEYTKNNEVYTAKAIDIDENGGLVIDTGNNIETLKSGEISVKLK